MKNLAPNVYPVISFFNGARTAAANGDAIVDMSGFEKALIEITSGVITDGTSYEFELTHGDDSALSDGVAVPATDLVAGGPAAGDKEPIFLVADDNITAWLEYIGTKRYLRIDLKTVVGSPVTGGLFTGTVIRHTPRHAPTL